ncbi:integral membrane protein terc [Lucifera butyrica]|uniref:Integral membrane protein terc n=1 Tax=Lucifera butyrica TaxID=1351585 RepID=A0A498R546_9FIRM|nr:TerC family protein [Lucifera butyrica]VBB05313.1 integral membrane protein terc [Lucifera butyrica]
MHFLIALSGIIMVNVILSGDNAIVIAMASRTLPPHERRTAVVWGSAGAILLRIILTFTAVLLLTVPYLQFAGGVTLVWIAAKLLLQGHKNENLPGASSFAGALKMIIAADLIMSLDNTLAIAAMAHGSLLLLTVGLLLSIPLIILGSQVIARIMKRFPVIVYFGAGLIAWTAGELMMRDEQAGVFLRSELPWWLLPLLLAAGVTAGGLWHAYSGKARRQTERVRSLSK